MPDGEGPTVSVTQPETKVEGKEGLNDATPLTAKDKPFAIQKGVMYSSWHKNTNYWELLKSNPLKVCLSSLRGRHEKFH